MTVTYSDLKRKGYILKESDTLTLHGIHYQVVKPGSYRWLSTTGKSSGRPNNIIFDILNLDKPEFLSKIFGAMPCRGSFPIMGSAEELTKLVIALYEQPMFHTGDKIRIAEHKEGTKYPFGFTDGMRKMSGKEYIIESVTINHENHIYRLADVGFSWSENQLIPVERASETPKDTVKEKDTQNADTTSINYVTLDMLKAGYIFKRTDHIPIGCLDCTIHHRYDSMCKNRYWISLEDRSEGAIYDELGISKEKKNAMAKECGALDTNYDSPEFGSLKDLSKFVIKILEYNKTPKENPTGVITYTDLKEGRVLSLGDKLSIYGIGYTVVINSRENRYYLMGRNCHNDAIFSKIGRLDDKFEWARRFDASVKDDGVFPELENLEKLTKFVIDIFEEARRKEASLATDRNFGPKVGAIPKGTPVVNVLFDESKEPISILPKKIKTNIIL